LVVDCPTPMRVYLESYGCTMNKGEGNALLRMLAGSHDIVDSPEDADIIFINTCTVIEATENKMKKRIREMAGLGRTVFVLGCMAVVQARELEDEFPGIKVVPFHEYELIPGMLEGGEGTRPLSSFFQGIVPISQGCLGDCAYCITRLARGVLVSYPIENILESVKEQVNAGQKEIKITSQDTGVYGMDTGSSLPGLLYKVLELEGDFKIRVGMMNPGPANRILGQLMDVMENERVFKFLHIPVQSGSDRILEAMGRRYSAQEFRDLVEAIRIRIPGMTIATDVITGFPGETDEDFEQTLELMKDTGPDIVNVTRFSPRPGTRAAGMKEQVVSRISKDRSRLATELRFEISRELNENYVDKEVEIMITEPGKPGTMMGRTCNYKPVVVKGNWEHGKNLRAEITDATPTYLIGVPIG